MLKYYFSTEVDPSMTPTNEGVTEVKKLLENLDKFGVPVELIDVAGLTEKDRTEIGRASCRERV